MYSVQIQRSQGSNLDWISFDLEPLTRQHVKRMAPNQKKNPTKKTKKIAAIKTVKKGASKKTFEKQLEKMGKQHERIKMQHEKLEEKMEEQHEKMEEQVEELKESLEEHVQDGAAHQIEEQLEQLKESLEEHVEDEAAHHFEEQLEKLEKKHGKLEEKMKKQHVKLKENMVKQHDKLKGKMEEGEESSSSSEEEESEDEEDEGSTTSSSEEEDDFDWLRGKMSGLFGSRTHFGSAHSRQVEIQDLCAEFFFHHPVQVDSENVDTDVTEHLHQAYRLVHLFSATFQSFLSHS